MTRSPRALALAAGVVALVGACAAEDSVAPTLPGSGSAGAGVAGAAVGAPGSAGASAGAAGAPGAPAAAPGTAGSGAEADTGAGVAGAAAGTGADTTGSGDANANAGTAGSAGVESAAGAEAQGAGDGSGAADPDCDLNGLWAVRLMSVVDALGLQQCGNLYYYMELRQQGQDVEVVDEFNCGIEGRGTANSSFSDATVQGLMQTNSQVGRHGTMRKGADGTCALEMETFWSVFGADEALYAPNPRSTAMNLSQLQSTTPMPTAAGAGVIDVEGDGFPGAAFIVTGALTGKRHAAQRNVQAWLTNERYKITPSLDWPSDIEARADYIGEDITFQVEPADNVLLAAGANPVRDAPAARVTLRFLGRDASDPRFAGIVVSSDPATDPAGATQTCANIVAALPPIVPLAFPNPQVCPCTGGGICM